MENWIQVWGGVWAQRERAGDRERRGRVRPREKEGNGSRKRAVAESAPEVGKGKSPCRCWRGMKKVEGEREIVALVRIGQRRWYEEGHGKREENGVRHPAGQDRPKS